jgi:nucleoside-diphosphate-sugar epimerase
MVRNVSVVGDDVFPKDARLKVVEGDVSKPDSIKAVLSGCTHAVYTASGTGGASSVAADDLGVSDTLAACKAEGVQRMVLNSAQLVDPNNNGWNPLRMLLNGLIAKGKSDCKFRSENRVRELAASGKTEYVIVRPGRLGDGEVGASGLLRVAQNNAGLSGQVHRGDVAAVLVAALTSDKVKNTTFELGAEPSEKPHADMSALFEGLPHTGDAWLVQK